MNEQSSHNSHDYLAASDKNAHLIGRSRFLADFRDLETECQAGFHSYGFRLNRIQTGEEEGSLDVFIENESSQNTLVLTLLVSDTADYPKSHSLLCYTADGDIPFELHEVIQDFTDVPPRPIRGTLLHLISKISKVIGMKKPSNDDASNLETSAVSDEESDTASVIEDDGDAYDFTMLSDDEFTFDPTSISSATLCDMALLQRHFIEIVASDYRPGIFRHSSDSFSLSISMPVLSLTGIIPPHALLAWDRAFLSKTQYLCLLISGFRSAYPVLNNDGAFTRQAERAGINIQFKVGLTRRYKPGKDEVFLLNQKHALVAENDRISVQSDAEEQEGTDSIDQPDELDQDKPKPDCFDGFSLSASLESLLNQSFFKLVRFRRQFNLTWLGAEKLLSEVERGQYTPEQAFEKFRDDVLAEEACESDTSRRIPLQDPLLGIEKEDPLNLPLIAFYYLIRRLALCPQYCIVCHRKLDSTYEALKPYVCGSKLCAYQYYSLNRGAPLEYEIIHNPYAVDLLVSLAYTAAAEGVLEDPPVGMDLYVPAPGGAGVLDGLCRFDELDPPSMRNVIVNQLDSLPTITEMRNFLIRNNAIGKPKPRLSDMKRDILPAAWLLLRWCVASCTAYIEQITSSEELVQGFDPTWLQFRFSVGAPNAEEKFRKAIEAAKRESKRAKEYPVLYAFHGSPLRNWHSIIRNGLWFKYIAHGRAFGHGVYLAKDGTTSTSGYSRAGVTWSKSFVEPSSCAALAEIVNLPHKFVSKDPYFVVNQTDWIFCRYLLVRGRKSEIRKIQDKSIPYVKLDPSHPVTNGQSRIRIPDPSHQVSILLEERQAEFQEEDYDEEDHCIFSFSPPNSTTNMPHIDGSQHATRAKVEKAAKDDWKHNANFVREAVANTLPPPEESTKTAIVTLQRELRQMLWEQEHAGSLKELGWYMPEEFNENNLFQWIVEMHSFDSQIPLAKDFKSKKLNSIIFEIRFPPSFPHSPPFFRIIKPRFLPFLEGGGGHVTAGGSICMDLLTADGWSPSYSIAAVLLQIKLAISSSDPRPARLHPKDWNRPYQPSEAVEGFKRAANIHGWRLPEGFHKLFR